MIFRVKEREEGKKGERSGGRREEGMEERREEREREKYQYERETLVSCHLYVPQPGIEPTTFWSTGWLLQPT